MSNGRYLFSTLVLFCLACGAFAACTWPIVGSGTSENVRTVQYLLRYRGESLSVDGIWGSGTSSAVKSFQSKNGITADGIVGKDTWTRLILDVKQGDRGDHVSAVQHQLRYHYSYTSVGVDGIFGSGTFSAVVSFQKSRTTIATGVVDYPTWLDIVDEKCNSTSPQPSGQTVQQAIAAAGCSTVVVQGLSQQLVAQTNCERSGLFGNITGMRNVRLSSAVAAVPYLQSGGIADLQRAVDARGGVQMTINSALRTLPQQLMLYQWYLQGKCGIKAAAKPGSSNHNGGAAVDINDASSWKSAMESHNWHKLGDWDPPHYDWTKAIDVRSLSVLAFQQLWNANNPNSKISVDGIYGSGTESAMLKSPVNGFPIGKTC